MCVSDVAFRVVEQDLQEFSRSSIDFHPFSGFFEKVEASIPSGNALTLKDLQEIPGQHLQLPAVAQTVSLPNLQGRHETEVGDAMPLISSGTSLIGL